MPAEIDTGGPRVLHCDYRAVCPIPIVTLASTESSLRHENRPIRASIARRLPPINSTDDGAVNCRRYSGFIPRRIGGTSAVRSGKRGYRENEPCTRLDPPTETNAPEACDPKDLQRNVYYLEQLESRLRDTTAASVDELEGCGSVSSIKNKRTIRRFRREPSRTGGNDHGDSRHGERGCCSKRDFSAENWPQVRAADCVRIGESLFSSQSNEPGAWTDQIYGKLVSTGTLPSLAPDEKKTREEQEEEEAVGTNSWRRESRVPKVEQTADHQAEFSRDSEPARCSRARTRKKKRRECTNSIRSSYFQLAFLLFLVTFGQCGLRKSSVFNGSAKTSSTGLSVLAIGTVISAVSAAPVDLMGDSGVRAERSANLSHITGASRKIQMYIKNRHLQILPDGTVNGSNDHTSDYTIFQRTSVSRGQLRIQGVATCLYLCMDSCGLLYGSREYTDDCVFNETLEQHNYNTYSSAKWSTTKKTMYLGLNRHGQPRRVQAKGHNLGRLSAYARVLTQVAPLERVEALQRRMLGAEHNVRHRHNNHRGDLLQQSLCPSLPVQEKDGRDKFRCRKRKKRKKRKRKCRPGEKPGPQCQVVEENRSGGGGGQAGSITRSDGLRSNGSSPESKRSCEGAASEEACRREALSVPSKKRKLRVEEATEGATGGRNVTASNGKNKAPASNAKKVNAAESISQSKKPNLTDGKKKKKKGPPARRNHPAVPLARKRFTPGRTDSGNTSAVPTATSASIFATSSSSWWSPGASTAPSGRGVSSRRRTKPSSARNEGVGSRGPLANPRRVGKAFARNRTKSIDRAAITTAYEPTTIPDQTSQSVTTKVPETVSDRLFQSSSSSSVEFSEIGEDTSKSLSESLSVDEDPSSTISNEHATTTIDSTTAISIDATSTPNALRFIEEESKSIEELDDFDDNDRFDESAHSTTPEASIERLAM
ncbi:uncharacterized protein LOC143207998 [Lasioglossum baleicum]|uniref:uncharacterized protein LOC143207998 n=1 Tax=Lasioglossum baleicum TaxID=434251 RepID=UPI003FCE1FAA